MSALILELHQRQPVFAWAGWIALAVLVLCLIAMGFDDRTINGVSVWTKPAKFAASFVPWFWTLAWAWGVLAPAARHGVLASVVFWATLVAAAYEQGWITLRAAQGLPSHFAEDALGAVGYALMGLGAAVLVVMAALLGLLVLWQGDAAQPGSWRLAVGLGLLVSGVLGGVTGFAISAHMGPHIGGTAGDAQAFPPFYWSRDGGDLRAAHFLAVHAMQAIPGFALLTGAGVAGIAGATLGWVALVAGALALALARVPLSP